MAAEATGSGGCKTLERLAAKCPDADRLHAALLLAFVNAVHKVLGAGCVPAPLFRFAFDEAACRLELRELDGDSLVPREGALDLEALDALLVANLRDIPLLFEGDTGVGKTYVSQAYLRAVFPRDSFVSLRLSGNTFLNNVFQPFLEGRIENGMPVTRVRQKAVERIAGMFVDEINRGDPQNVLQLLDNELYNAGEYQRLGIGIPHLEDGVVTGVGPRQKKLCIIAAENPAADAKFTSTTVLDAAVDNRLLRLLYGNAAHTAGTSIWLTRPSREPHEELRRAFEGLVVQYLGVDGSALEDLEGEWLRVYAWLADSSFTDRAMLTSAMELADFMVVALGGGLVEKYVYEREVVDGWLARLGLPPSKLPDLPESESLSRFEAAVATFKVPFIFRDVVQIKKLADVLGTLRTLEEAAGADEPVQAWLDADRSVTVREVAGAAGLVALNKQRSGSESPVPAVNELLGCYSREAAAVQKRTGYPRERLDLHDPRAGLKQLLIHRALEDVLKARGGARALRDRLAGDARQLLEGLTVTEQLRSLLLMRVAGDLLTLAGFLAAHEARAERALAGAGRDPLSGTEQLVDLYYDVVGERPASVPDIFQHRILRTLGA